MANDYKSELKYQREYARKRLASLDPQSAPDPKSSGFAAWIGALVKGKAPVVKELEGVRASTKSKEKKSGPKKPYRTVQEQKAIETFKRIANQD